MTRPLTYHTPTAEPRSVATTSVVPELHEAPVQSTVLKASRANAAVQAAVHEISAFHRLSRNWDSYGGEPPTDAAIATATEVLLSVGHLIGSWVGERIEPEYVAPRADGGVQIEWAAPSSKVSVSASATGELGYLFVEKHDGERHAVERHSQPLSEIQKMVARIAFMV